MSATSAASTNSSAARTTTRETMRTRLQAYYKETSPLIGYYYAKGMLQAVDGMAEIDDVQNSTQIDAGIRRELLTTNGHISRTEPWLI